jgi:hypothetical protein
MPYAIVRQAPTPLLLAGLFIAESILFYVQVAIHVAPFYPPNFDQTSYLIEVYRLVEIYRATGWSIPLWQAIQPHLPNTALFPIQGAISVRLSGLLRTGALTVNLAYFLALQFVVFWFVTWKRRNTSEAWIAVSLLLLLHTIFTVGGILDFRIDFMAMCLFGIWTCVVIRSRLFRHRGWSLVSAAIATWLIANRYIVVVYAVPILAILATHAFVTLIRSNNRTRYALARTRIRNILTFSLIVLIGTGPLLYASRHLLRTYYYESMFTTAEAAIRSRQYVGSDLVLDHLTFYPTTIADMHIGVAFFVAAAAIIGGLFVLSMTTGERPMTDIAQSLTRWKTEFGFLIILVLVPLVLLNLSIHKSPVIGGILCVPIVLLVLYVGWGLFDTIHSVNVFGKKLNPTGRALKGALVGSIITYSATTFMYRMAQPWPVDAVESASIGAFSDKIVTYALTGGLQNPTFSVDRIEDYMNAGVLLVNSYERHRRLIDFRGLLGSSDLSAPTQTEAMQMLADSDIVVLTARAQRADIEPFDQKIETYWPTLMLWAQENLLSLATTTLQGIRHQAFVVPLVGLSGASTDGWIESSGVVLEVDPSLVTRWPYVVLTGTYNPQWLQGPLHPRAVLEIGDGRSSKDLPVDLKTGNDHYRIVIDMRFLPLSENGSIKVALTFDRYFVPRSFGSNDTRELVIRTPDRRELRTGP